MQCIPARLQLREPPLGAFAFERGSGPHVKDSTMKNSPLAFVQAGPMDPWAPMQKAFLDALVLH